MATKKKAAMEQVSGSVSLAKKVRAANRWRDSLNPLRGLTISRAVGLLEAYPRGEMADLQWTNLFIEGADADLFAIVDRRTSAISEMDFDIQIVPENRRRKDFDEKLADDQKAALQEGYDRIENLYELFAHLLLAKFRGFAHAEKARTVSGDVTHFEIVDQWNIVRDGFNGDWKYNPEAQQTTFAALSADLVIPPEDFIIRECRRFVDRIALIKFIRSNLSDKDWDAFIEIYGIPPVIIIGPPNVPPEKEAEYTSAAQETSEGGSGYLPHGADAKFSTEARGQNPFRDRLEFLSEKLILVGTGGLLTMLTQSGSGTLAGTAHTETFKMLAKMDGRDISEVLQKQFDKEILGRAFPGQPVLSYFSLAINEEQDPEKVVDMVDKLSRAGFKGDAAELSELTGLTLREAPPETITLRPQAGPGAADAITKQAQAEEAAVANRARADLSKNLKDKTPAERATFLNSRQGKELILTILNSAGYSEVDSTSQLLNPSTDSVVSSAESSFKRAHSMTLQPVGRAIANVLSASAADAPAAMKKLRDGLGSLLKQINKNPATANVLDQVQTAALFNGADDAAAGRSTIKKAA